MTVGLWVTRKVEAATVPFYVAGQLAGAPSAAPPSGPGPRHLRAVRSFEPCMPCTTHIDTGRGVIVRDVNSCGCTLD